jgi:hypothetical protein
MSELAAPLDALPSRHLHAILHCCFAGTFRWAGGTRALLRPPQPDLRARQRLA